MMRRQERYTEKTSASTCKTRSAIWIKRIKRKKETRRLAKRTRNPNRLVKYGPNKPRLHGEPGPSIRCSIRSARFIVRHNAKADHAVASVRAMIRARLCPS